MKRFRAEIECFRNRATQNLQQCEPTSYLPRVYDQTLQSYRQSSVHPYVPVRSLQPLTILTTSSPYSSNAVAESDDSMDMFGGTAYQHEDLSEVFRMVNLERLVTLLHTTDEHDANSRDIFCEWVADMSNDNEHFTDVIVWIDEATFTLSGIVNRHNCVYWADGNLHIVDGSPPHYHREVRSLLDGTFVGRLMGRRGSVECPPRYPDLTPLDFYVHATEQRALDTVRNVTLNACEYTPAETACVLTGELSAGRFTSGAGLLPFSGENLVADDVSATYFPTPLAAVNCLRRSLPLYTSIVMAKSGNHGNPASWIKKRGSVKGDTPSHIKCAITTKRKVLKWRAVFSSHCVYLWDFQRTQHSPTPKEHNCQSRMVNTDERLTTAVHNRPQPPETLQDLIRAAKREWDLPPEDNINTLITSIPRRSYAVLSCSGKKETPSLPVRGTIAWFTITRAISRLPLTSQLCADRLWWCRERRTWREECRSWLDYSHPTKANQFRFPAGSPSHFPMRELCQTMPLVDGFSRGSPIFPTSSFRRCSIHTSLTLVGSQDLYVKSHPNLCTHSPPKLPYTRLGGWTHIFFGPSLKLVGIGKAPGSALQWPMSVRRSGVHVPDRWLVESLTTSLKLTPMPYLGLEPRTSRSPDRRRTNVLRHGRYKDYNARCPVSRDTMQWYADNNVRRLDWPAQSPDLNPIEHLWDELDRRVRARQARPKSVAQLMEWLQEEWRRIPVDVLQTLVESMPDMNKKINFARGVHPGQGHILLMKGFQAGTGRCPSSLYMARNDTVGKGGGNGSTPRKTRRQATSSSTILTCENPRINPDRRGGKRAPWTPLPQISIGTPVEHHGKPAMPYEETHDDRHWEWVIQAKNNSPSSLTHSSLRSSDITPSHPFTSRTPRPPLPRNLAPPLHLSASPAEGEGGAVTPARSRRCQSFPSWATEGGGGGSSDHA
ncbi:hypothetical protein PR048_010077 [Dryococelus australis]|uniref:Tc1-like transposase DDE domain-containing protein n=1 Tax=Dryococelus australis TaxID=614101 RepID=A0ABQ9I1Q6_9NEOP|nr:hypothetical protein PR048_010077 [Dryococelus australis]